MHFLYIEEEANWHFMTEKGGTGVRGVDIANMGSCQILPECREPCQKCDFSTSDTLTVSREFSVNLQVSKWLLRVVSSASGPVTRPHPNFAMLELTPVKLYCGLQCEALNHTLQTPRGHAHCGR